MQTTCPLPMAEAARDSFLNVISEVYVNPQYQDITDSFVSNEGNFDFLKTRAFINPKPGIQSSQVPNMDKILHLD